MLTRRVFAKVMSLAPAAASMAGNVAGANPGPPPMNFGTQSAPSSGLDVPDYDHGHWLKGQIAELQGYLDGNTLDPEDRERCRDQALKRLDPDIKAMRSFSGVAKLMMQQERNERRMLADRQGHWQRVLGHRMRELAGLKS